MSTVDHARVRVAMRKVGDRLESERLDRIAATPAPTSPPLYAERYMTPCGHFKDGKRCGVTPTRRYLVGPRCVDDTPAKLNGRDENHPDPARSLDGLREAAGRPNARPPVSA